MAAISQKIVDRIMLSGRAGQRLLNETSVQLEVWARFAAAPDDTLDLLLNPFGDTPSSQLARDLLSEFRALSKRKRRKVRTDLQLAPLEGVVAVRLGLDEFIDVVLPQTNLDIRGVLDELRSLLQAYLETAGRPRSAPRLPDLVAFAVDPKRSFAPDMRVAVLVALILTVRSLESDLVLSLERMGEEGDTAVVWDTGHEAAAPQRSIYRVSMNRPVEPMGVSVETIKADAAHRVFEITCADITWAIIDSGIDGSHPAFRDHEAGDWRIRVDKAYDFTKVRTLSSYDLLLDDNSHNELLEEIRRGLGLSDGDAEKWLRRLRDDAEMGRPLDWEALSRLIEVRTDQLPQPPDGSAPNGHGTHVAGVLAGDWRENGKVVFSGVCPDIRIYDLRVLGRTDTDTEFAVVAALEFVRWVNARNRFMTIHGVNLSLGLKHRLTDYACGRTPVCMACEATVDNGVSVVAAAGNWGTHDFLVNGGDVFTGYAAISIADPGNADSVITVGSTHRDRPHEYGVSFFSSRGPTGDGRRKPDLVAPGERIEGPLPNIGFGRLDGTSMSAPHVSGVAALLMARNRELIGKPRRIKAVIVDTATDLGRERDFQGAGLVDALRALQAV